MPTPPVGVHLVGSINLPTTEDVFTQIPALLSNRIRRIPDGETGIRSQFISWQWSHFAAAPEVLVPPIAKIVTGKDPVESPAQRTTDAAETPGPHTGEGDFAWSQYTRFGDQSDGASPAMDNPSTSNTANAMTPAVAAAIRKLQGLETQFDTYALASYAIFKQQKEKGEIAPHVRFQVCLPGVVNVIVGIRPEYQLAVESLYEEALVRALDRIQNSIPHTELAIQIDIPCEIAFIEGAGPWESYISDPFPGVVNRLSRFADRVASSVELGLHLCYGDLGHKHFAEPKDLSLVVDLTNALHKKTQRNIQWIHVPVPKDRTNEAYFAPLQKLDWEVPELYLGLVHANDEEGTRKRIDTARKFVQEFGIATECGLGRTPVEDFASIMQISQNLSGPVEGAH